MKKITWFTHTNIVCIESQKLEFDLTDLIDVFIKNEVWNKTRYRTEYNFKFDQTDLQKIKSIKVNIHTDIAPFSNFHTYENIINNYIDLAKIEKTKIFTSGITEAKKIAVIEVEFESENDLINNLTYEQEKDPKLIFEQLTEKNFVTWNEFRRIKSIICEFIQFFMFNLHLNYLTHQYTFSISDKSELIGFSIVSESDNYYYETDRIDLLSHYILYSKKNDILKSLMSSTSKFWCNDISSIHFFLDALKSNYITSTNFIKLVFTLESFFGQGVSNDYITLVIPLLISKKIAEMKNYREIMKTCFNLRNKIVHGNSLINFLEESYKGNKSKSAENVHIDKLFFELKNIITHIFFFYINRKLYLRKDGKKINHELIFSLIPNGLN